jgi:hypothetical protein
MLSNRNWVGLLAVACVALAGKSAHAALAACTPLTIAQRGYVKFQPGHYVQLGALKWNYDPLPDTLGEIKSIPGIVGVQKRYFWSDLQTNQYEYDFKRLQADIAAVKAAGKKLSVFISWKFKTDKGNNPIPAYLSNLTTKPTYYEMDGTNGGPNAKGYLAAFDNPVVANEFIRFLGKLQAVIDGDPAVSTLVFVESAMGMSFTSMTSAQATTIKNAFWDQLLRIDKEASCLFKHTPVLQLTNAPANRFDSITQDFMKWGIAFGGPDVWLDDPDLLTYKYFPTVQKYVPIGMLVGGGNYIWYSHEDEVNQIEEKAIDYSPSQIIKMLADKARNDLYSNYVFWKKNGQGDQYYDAFIAEAKKLNTSSQTIQPLWTDCPLDFLGICRP